MAYFLRVGNLVGWCSQRCRAARSFRSRDPILTFGVRRYAMGMVPSASFPGSSGLRLAIFAIRASGRIAGP